MGSFITTTRLLTHRVWCRGFWGNIKSHRWLSSPTAQIWCPATSDFSQTKITFVNESQEDTTGQLMVTGRTVWGPKVPMLKGTEVSSSYVQCFLYLVSFKMPLFFIAHGWILYGQTLYMEFNDLQIEKWSCWQTGITFWFGVYLVITLSSLALNWPAAQRCGQVREAQDSTPITLWRWFHWQHETNRMRLEGCQLYECAKLFPMR